MIELQLPEGPLTIVCLGAHPDDIELGCGGSLLRLATARDLIVEYVLASGTSQRHAEARAASSAVLPGAQVAYHLGSLPDGRLPAVWAQVKQTLEDVADRSRPQLVFAPRRDDAHQDHRLVGELASTVWRDALVLHYEIPKWDGDLGPVTHYIPLPDDIVARKLDALNRSFVSQHERDWWDDETFRSILRLRGIECRTRYAEGFTLTKAVLRI